MQAETVYAVYEALPEQEKQRLLCMLQVSDVKVKKVAVKKPMITDAEARQFIINKYSKFSAKWKMQNQAS